MPPTFPLNADLHCHSTVSDGWLTPSDLVQRAAANGVELLALTDHDEIAGIGEAVATARLCGIGFVPGVEISVTFLDETIHVVGLNIDPDHPVLLEGLRQVRSGREERARQMSEALDAIGIHDVLEGARQFARNPALVGRAHFARHLVAIGLMPDVATVFRHYLARGKPGYVPHVWARLEDAVGWIRAAGGIAVMAHPGRYHLAASDMNALFDRFVDHGGEAVEVVSGAHTAAEVQRFASVARRRGLLASRASDFHGGDESPVDLGRGDPLPPDLVPVWSRFPELARIRDRS